MSSVMISHFLIVMTIRCHDFPISLHRLPDVISHDFSTILEHWVPNSVLYSIYFVLIFHHFNIFFVLQGLENFFSFQNKSVACAESFENQFNIVDKSNKYRLSEYYINVICNIYWCLHEGHMKTCGNKSCTASVVAVNCVR
jgi:hypothetical protein